MKRFFTALVFAGLILPALWTGTARAQEGCDDKVVVGDSFTVAEGETFECDLIVFGGSLTVEEGATVTGSIAVFGGIVEVAGDVANDLVVFGGSVDLRSTAVVDGRLITVGGTVHRDKGAVVSGGEGNDFGYNYDSGEYPSIPWVPGLPDGPRFSPLDPLLSAMWHGMEIVGGALAMGLIALLVAAVWPDPTRRVSSTLIATPAVAGGLGLLTLIAVPVLLILLAITIILSPVAVLGALLYGMAIVFGWLALGSVVGERLSVAFNRPTANLALTTALGTLLLSLVMGIVGTVPCLGFIVQVIFAAIGVGAVMLTGFGMRPYQAGPALPEGPTVSAPPPGAEPDSAAPTEPV